MSYKSRGNYPIGMYVSQEAWDNMFPKEKKDESKTGVRVRISTNSQSLQGTPEECLPEISNGNDSNQ